MNVYDSIVLQVRKEYAEEGKIALGAAMKEGLQIFLSALTAGAEIHERTHWE